jgi:hypothetical protein
LTPLQVWQTAVRDLLVDARASLDPRSFCAFVDFVCAAIAREAVRCVKWERRHGTSGVAA